MIIGGKGFIGASVSRLLAAEDTRVVVIEPDIKRRGRLHGLGDMVQFIQCSVTDRERLLEVALEVNPTAIANLVYVRSDSIADEMDIMCRGQWNALEVAARTGCRRVVLASSVRVYGTQAFHGESTTLNESTVCNPVVRYGHYKRLGERLVEDYRTAHDLEAVALRIPAVYGPGIRAGAFGVATPALAAAERRDLVLPYDPDSKQCLAYVDDVARAIAEMLRIDKQVPDYPLYELGGNVISYGEMATIAHELESATQVSFQPERDAVERSTNVAYQLDGSRLRAEYGFVHRSVYRGYADIIEATRNNGVGS